MLSLRARATLWTAAIFSLASAGCCSTFERDWQAGLACPQPADRLAGLWEGSWESAATGHGGKLRAIVTPCGANRYVARYDARFCWFVPYGYDMPYAAADDGMLTHFHGVTEVDSLIGGAFRCAGWADGRTYSACVQANHDQGVFHMHRVGCVAAHPSQEPPFEGEPALSPGVPTLSPGVPPAPRLPYEETTVTNPDSLPPRPPM